MLISYELAHLSLVLEYPQLATYQWCILSSSWKPLTNIFHQAEGKIGMIYLLLLSLTSLDTAKSSFSEVTYPWGSLPKYKICLWNGPECINCHIYSRNKRFLTSLPSSTPLSSLQINKWNLKCFQYTHYNFQEQRINLSCKCSHVYEGMLLLGFFWFCFCFV